MHGSEFRLLLYHLCYLDLRLCCSRQMAALCSLALPRLPIMHWYVSQPGSNEMSGRDSALCRLFTPMMPLACMATGNLAASFAASATLGGISAAYYAGSEDERQVQVGCVPAANLSTGCALLYQVARVIATLGPGRRMHMLSLLTVRHAAAISVA